MLHGKSLSADVSAVYLFLKELEEHMKSEKLTSNKKKKKKDKKESLKGKRPKSMEEERKMTRQSKRKAKSAEELVTIGQS